MSGKSSKSNVGKIALGVSVALIGFVALMYAALLRPFMAPKPLVELAPDEAAIVVSIDLYNTGNTGYKYIRAIGLGRFQDLMASDEEEEEGSGMPGKMVKLAWPWLTREILVVGNVPEAEDPQFAVLIGSHNQAKAEKNFPKMLELIKEESALAAEKDSPAEAKRIRAQKIKFKDTKLDGVTIHCNENPEVLKGEFCWASTKRALVVSPSQDMVKTAVSSINGKRTERQKQLADMRKLDISDKYVMYAYADRAKLMKELNIPIADEMLAKESQAVRGALYSLSYSDLSPEMRVGLVLDQKKLKDTRILSKLTAYEPSIHRVGNRIDSEDSLMYLSVNNIDEMMKSMIAEISPEDRKDIEKECRVQLCLCWPPRPWCGALFRPAP